MQITLHKQMICKIKNATIRLKAALNKESRGIPEHNNYII